MRLSLIILSVVLSGCFHPSQVYEENSSPLMNIASSVGFSFMPLQGKETSFLHAAIDTKNGILPSSTILLRNDDRSAAVYFLTSGESDAVMNRITESAFLSFSISMENLVDDTLIQDGYAPIDVLAFTDPTLSEERIFIAHIRDTIYEFHIADKQEPYIQGLLLELARE